MTKSRFRKGDALSEKELEKLYMEASDAYYNTGAAILEDDEFDALKAKLKAANPNNPALSVVGAPIRDATRRVTLPYWMGSLDKIRDDANAIKKWKTKFPGNVVVSDKLDGCSGMLIIDGVKTLYSRGDGQVGQDCSSLIKYIKGVHSNKKVVVRGEVILPRKAWEEKVKAKGGANARNVTAGVMNAKKPDPNIAKELEFVAYELIEPKGYTPSEGMQWMEDAGFIVVSHHVLTESELTMDALSAELVERRNNSAYEVDGIVIMHDELHRNIKHKNPTHAFAFKSVVTHNEAEVIVSNVEWNVSKDGYMKPTVIFEPVFLNGVTIRRATGFNAAYIRANGIGVGAKVVIIRSGDVIPKIVRIVTPAPGGPLMPPAGTWEWVTGTGTGAQVDIRAVAGNASADAAAAASALEFFAKTMEMEFVGRGTINKLAENGVTSIRDLMSLDARALKALNMGDKNAERIAASIQKVKAQGTCDNFMVASNLFGRGIGGTRVKAILEMYPEILNGVVPQKQRKVEGVGQKTLDGFFAGLPKFFEMMNDIGVPCTIPTTSQRPPEASQRHALINQVIVFTGFRDKALKEVVEERGGVVAAGITKKTTLVVAKDPDEDSTKLAKARDMGIKIVGKDDFLKK